MIHPDISLGIARASDALRIATLSRDLVESGLGWSWTTERVGASIRNRAALVVAARAGERVVGFGIMRYGEDEAHLDLLGVDPEHRRAGLGRRLVEWLEKPAVLAGLASAVLEVRASNRGAQAFYQRLGYRSIAHLAGYYHGRESALRMARALGAPPPAPFDVWSCLPEELRPARPWR